MIIVDHRVLPAEECSPKKNSVTTEIHIGRVVSLPVVCNEFKFEKVLFSRLDGLHVIPGQPFLWIFKQQG